jgi:hypothetical protein
MRQNIDVDNKLKTMASSKVLENHVHTIKSDRVPPVWVETEDGFTSIPCLNPIDPSIPSGKQKQQKVVVEHHTTNA